MGLTRIEGAVAFCILLLWRYVEVQSPQVGLLGHQPLTARCKPRGPTNATVPGLRSSKQHYGVRSAKQLRHLPGGFGSFGVGFSSRMPRCRPSQMLALITNRYRTLNTTPQNGGKKPGFLSGCSHRFLRTAKPQGRPSARLLESYLGRQSLWSDGLNPSMNYGADGLMGQEYGFCTLELDHCSSICMGHAWRDAAQRPKQSQDKPQGEEVESKGSESRQALIDLSIRIYPSI